jgi:hypothetical protein
MMSGDPLVAGSEVRGGKPQLSSKARLKLRRLFTGMYCIWTIDMTSSSSSFVYYWNVRFKGREMMCSI